MKELLLVRDPVFPYFRIPLFLYSFISVFPVGDPVLQWLNQREGSFLLRDQDGLAVKWECYKKLHKMKAQVTQHTFDIFVSFKHFVISLVYRFGGRCVTTSVGWRRTRSCGRCPSPLIGSSSTRSSIGRSSCPTSSGQPCQISQPLLFAEPSNIPTSLICWAVKYPNLSY